MAQNIGRFFVMAVFDGPIASHGEEHFVEEYMPNELFPILEEEAKRKYPSVSGLHELQSEWDFDRMFITVGASITNPSSAEEDFVTINFHIDNSGDISNITMDG
jgi:hypothetical protein